VLTHCAADGAHPEDALRPPIAHHASTAHPHAAAAAAAAGDAPRLLGSTWARSFGDLQSHGATCPCLSAFHSRSNVLDCLEFRTKKIELLKKSEMIPVNHTCSVLSLRARLAPGTNEMNT
jgi:hypothetical protein